MKSRKVAAQYRPSARSDGDLVWRTGVSNDVERISTGAG
jgi:hypothetical protein